MRIKIHFSLAIPESINYLVGNRRKLIKHEIMDEKQTEFLKLHVIEQRSYKEIAITLGEEQATLSYWYDKLKAEREDIAKIMLLHSRKGIMSTRLEFYNWFKANERKCVYCGITEEEIKHMLDNKRLETKRIATRGRKLELDRKVANNDYHLVNIVFSCYWCNNAKTDTFTFDEFKQIGQAISEIWKKRLAQ